MPIESSQPVGASRAIAAADARLVRQAAGERQQGEIRPAQPALVSTSAALDAGPAPVDNERVAEVRKAVETGTYPLVPMKVADAIIAAGMLLRSPQ